MPERIKRDKDSGDAIVRYDHNNKLRYVYEGSDELDMGSSVEERIPHKIQYKDIGQIALPPVQIIELAIQDPEDSIRDYVLPETTN
jgi:hypothetical protein